MAKLIILIFSGVLAAVICEDLLCSKEGTVCGGTKGIKCCENQHLKCQLIDDSINASGTCVKTCSEKWEFCSEPYGSRVCCPDQNLHCNLERSAGGRCQPNI